MKFLSFSQTKLGSSLSLPAYGREGQGQRLLFWRRISQSEIRNSAAAEKSESESEGGQKFLPPNPLPFCLPERSVFCSAKGGAISRSFVQKRFELRSAIATIIKTRLKAGFDYGRAGGNRTLCFMHPMHACYRYTTARYVALPKVLMQDVQILIRLPSATDHWRLGYLR